MDNDNNTIRLVVVLVLVLVIGVILMSSFGKKDTNIQNIQNNECILLKQKKYEGMLFGGCFDIWHVSHFILWFMVGILVPNYYLQVIIASIVWELIEDYSFKKFKKCDSVFCGRVEDVFTNIFAYLLGSYFKNNGFFPY